MNAASSRPTGRRVKHYELALQAYATLIRQGQKQYRTEQANAWVNLGNARARQSEPTLAAEHFEDALQTYAELVQDGQIQNRAEQSKTWMNLGSIRLKMGELPKALLAFEHANQINGVLAQSGLWQHQTNWVYSVQQIVGVVYAVDAESKNANLICLRRTMSELKGLILLDTDLQAQHLWTWLALNQLCKALETRASLQVRHTSDENSAVGRELTQKLVSDALTLSFDYVGRLLREADPIWQAKVWQVVKTQLLDLGLLCLRIGGQWPLNWYLCTQGLRSQRIALMQSDDPKLQAFYNDWQRLDTLSQQISARSNIGVIDFTIAGLEDDSGPPRAEVSHTAHTKMPSAGAAGQLDALYSQWRLLNKQVNAQKQALKNLLPEQRGITLELVHQHLPARQALVALIEIAPWQGWLTAVWADAKGGETKSAWQNWGAPVDLQAARGDRAQFELTWLASANAALAQDGQRSSAPRRGMGAEDATTHVGAALPHEAVTHYCTSLRAATQPLWAMLRAQGIERAHWLVNGGLHAVPWQAVLADDLHTHGLKASFYPHTAAWLSGHDDSRRKGVGHAAAIVKPREASSAVAWLCHDPAEVRQLGHADLPSIALECGLGQQWWAAAGRQVVNVPAQQPQWLQQAEQPPVQALFVLAHGFAPIQSNTTLPANSADAAQVSQSVIVLGRNPDGQTRHFGAAQLRGIEHARYVVFNSCITGRSQDVMTETLGLLAQAFDHEARFVVGAMVYVGDWEAMLIGSAYQYVLTQQWQQGLQPDWADSFAMLQDQVRAGQWPAGFVDALGQNWKAWCRSQQNSLSQQAWQELRRQLNLWLHAQNLAPLRSLNDADWDADWQQLAVSISTPSVQVQRTIDWYVAHGVG